MVHYKTAMQSILAFVEMSVFKELNFNMCLCKYFM